MGDAEGLWAMGVGVPSLLFRFCAHATLGIYTNHANSVWNMIKGHDIPSIPPYSPDVMRSTQIAERWAEIAFYWNFAMWIPTAFFPNILVMATGAFDLFLAVQFAISTALQASWMPRKTGHCADIAETWQVPDNHTASIFTLVGSFNETAIPAKKVCEHYVNSWNHGVASLVLYCLIVFCNIGIGMAVFFIISVKDNKNEKNQRWFTALLNATWVIPLIILKLILVIFDLLVSILPCKIPNMIRFPVRYITKAAQVLISPIWRGGKRAISAPNHIKLRVFKKQKETDIDMSTIKNERLLHILHFDTLSLISQHLHYTDIINFSLASKAVREVTFPASDLANRRRLYKKYTCEEVTKSNCFVCKRQICEPCTTSRYFGTRLTRTRHGERCKAQCTKCYIKSSAKRMVVDHCICPGKVGYMSDQGSPTLVCRFCALEPVPDNIKRCGEWERLHLTDENKKIDRCQSCGYLFPWWSPKWWVCSLCNRDCWSSIHPSWS